jgi:hypothetical protein
MDNNRLKELAGIKSEVKRMDVHPLLFEAILYFQNVLKSIEKENEADSLINVKDIYELASIIDNATGDDSEFLIEHLLSFIDNQTKK